MLPNRFGSDTQFGKSSVHTTRQGLQEKAIVFLSTVELYSIKNIVKGKDQFILHYQFSSCLILKSLKKLPIFEILLEYSYWLYSTEFDSFVLHHQSEAKL